MVLLLTGATGGLGAGLVEALCAADEVAEVHVLVHRTPFVATSPKVSVVLGDVTDGADLGLPSTTAAELRPRLTAIVHGAADTRFTAPADALHAANVEGTSHALAFAARCPRLDRVSLLSTVYVAGARTGTIYEHELDHAAGFVNPYERSKHDAETIARTWMDRLPLSVVRLSTVVGNVPSGSRPLGAIHQAIRLMYRSLVPMVPGRAEHPVDLVPAEYAVRAVAWLASRGFRPGGTFHVVAGGDTMTVAELVDLTMETFIRCRPAWRTRAIARPAVVGLDTFELFRRSVDEVGDWTLRDSTAVISAFAPQLAYPKVFDDERCRVALDGSGIVRPPVRTSYVHMVEQLVGA